LHLQKP